MKKHPTEKQIAAVMGALGSRKSEAKAKAARENGKKGGRPKKKKESWEYGSPRKSRQTW